eukprot:jgi/Ulvmu1/6046/UM027_0023.1
MGIFTCCVKSNILLEADLQRISDGTAVQPVSGVSHQSTYTQTDIQLLDDLPSQHCPPASPRSGSEAESPGNFEELQLSEQISPEQSKDVASPTSVQDDGLDRRMSARDLKKLHSGASPGLMDDMQSPGSELCVKDEDTEKAVRKVFLEYARFGTRDKKAKTLDVYRFMKLIRECSLMTSADRAAAVDLIFCKGTMFCAVCKDSPADARLPMPPRSSSSPLSRYIMSSKCKHWKGGRMDFAGFQRALQHIAELLGVPEADVRRAVAASRGPLVNAVTLPRFVRLHDDGAANPEKVDVASKHAAEGGRVVERTPGTYPKGMVKAADASCGTSGFVPFAGARPGSPCFAAAGTT